jgi:hypothetical protein
MHGLTCSCSPPPLKGGEGNLSNIISPNPSFQRGGRNNYDEKIVIDRYVKAIEELQLG